MEVRRSMTSQGTDIAYTREQEESLDERLQSFSRVAPEFSKATHMHDFMRRLYHKWSQSQRRTTTSQERDELASILSTELKVDQAQKDALVTASLIGAKDFFPHRNKHGGANTPALMANQEHYLFEHGLHTTMIVTATAAHIKTKPLITDLTVTPLHDDWEDPAIQLRHSLLQIYQKFKDIELKEVGVPTLLGIERMTIRVGETYTDGLEKIFRDFDPRELPVTELLYRFQDYDLLNRWDEDHENSRQSARRAKLADKISAMQTLDPFPAEKKIRLFGKAFLVLNNEREYSHKHDSNKLTKYLSQVLAYEMRRSLSREIEAIEERLPSIVQDRPYVNSIMAKNQAMADHYVSKLGGLERLEFPSSGFINQDFGGTLYRSLVLGMHLEEGISIPDALKDIKETDDEARKRLVAEKITYRYELPNKRFYEYDTKFDRDESDKFLRAHRRFCVLWRAAGKYADQPNFYLPLGGVQ